MGYRTPTLGPISTYQVQIVMAKRPKCLDHGLLTYQEKSLVFRES